MSNTAQHTPTPWLPSRRADAIVVEHMDDEYQSSKTVQHYGGFVVAESLNEADRAFVLRACNSHEQLVAAVRKALAECVDLIATPAGNALEAALTAAGAA